MNLTELYITTNANLFFTLINIELNVSLFAKTFTNCSSVVMRVHIFPVLLTYLFVTNIQWCPEHRNINCRHIKWMNSWSICIGGSSSFTSLGMGEEAPMQILKTISMGNWVWRGRGLIHSERMTRTERVLRGLSWMCQCCWSTTSMSWA